MPNPLSPGVASPEGFLPGARAPLAAPAAPATRASDRYGAWVSEPARCGSGRRQLDEQFIEAVA